MSRQLHCAALHFTAVLPRPLEPHLAHPNRVLVDGVCTYTTPHHVFACARILLWYDYAAPSEAIGCSWRSSHGHCVSSSAGPFHVQSQGYSFKKKWKFFSFNFKMGAFLDLNYSFWNGY